MPRYDETSRVTHTIKTELTPTDLYLQLQQVRQRYPDIFRGYKHGGNTVEVTLLVSPEGEAFMNDLRRLVC